MEEPEKKLFKEIADNLKEIKTTVATAETNLKRLIDSGSSNEKEALAYLEVYKGYNSVLRTWFVTFGIGGLYLLVTKPEITQNINNKGQLEDVVDLFMVGVGAQIIVTFINKTASWSNYLRAENSKYRGRTISRIMGWISNQFWFDVAADLATIFCFGYIVWIFITIYLPK